MNILHHGLQSTARWLEPVKLFELSRNGITTVARARIDKFPSAPLKFKPLKMMNIRKNKNDPLFFTF